jgi:uncharacterized protein
MNKTSLLPQPARLVSLDVLRGIALLGILIMNIQSFAMISAAYLNPTAFGDLTGLNKNIWIISHVLADQKFLSIFSMLFGAGIILFCNNVEERGYLPARFYYRRLFWLFTFGLIHGYLLWHGDILVAYAICGALAFLFRKLHPIVLIAIGLILFFVPSFNYWLFGSSLEMWPPEAIENLKISWAPEQGQIDQEIAALTGSIQEQLTWKIPETFKMETFIFFIYMGWRALAFMLMGMGLFRLGFFSNGFDKKTYGLTGIVGLLLGYGLIIVGVNKNFDANWTVEYSMFFGWQWNYYGSLFVAIGYAALVMLLVKSWKLTALARVGKMAFTNYVFTTLICTFIFYGYGLGLLGEFERWQQLIVVGGVWVLILLASWFWLQKFKYGPLEWLWRYLTYGNKPDFKKK